MNAALVQFIKDNPAISATILGLVYTLCGWLGGVWAGRIARREENENARRLKELEDKLNRRLKEYEIKTGLLQPNINNKALELEESISALLEAMHYVSHLWIIFDANSSGEARKYMNPFNQEAAKYSQIIESSKLLFSEREVEELRGFRRGLSEFVTNALKDFEAGKPQPENYTSGENNIFCWFNDQSNILLQMLRRKVGTD